MNVAFEFIPSDGLNDKFKQIERIIDKIEKLSNWWSKLESLLFYHCFGLMGYRVYSDYGAVNKCGIPFYHNNLEGSLSQHDTLKCFKERETNTDTV